MRRGLPSVVVLFLSLLLFPSQILHSQESEIKIPAILKGARNPETLPDLDEAYCPDGASDDIYLDPSDIPVGNTNIIWSVTTNVGGIPMTHPGWFEPIGAAPNNGIRFFPDRVPPEFQGTAIFIQYQFDDGTWGYDYTYIRKSPTVFDLSGDVELCSGKTGILTLNGSESNFEYFLFLDGLPAPALPVSGNGQPLTFSVSAAGTYTVEARRSERPYCSVLMNGAPEVVVNALPAPTASSNSPVCEGASIELYGDPDGAVVYSWSGPNGYTSNDLNPVIAGASPAMAGSYTLTVIDANGCQNTSFTNVVVHANPVVTLSNDGPVCENHAVTLAATVTGGTGPFTYSWEKDGTALPLITTPNIVVSNASLADAGVYEVFVTDANACSNVVSASTSLVVNENPVIDAVSNNGPLCAGENLSLSVSASGGSGIYTYAWSGPAGFTSTEQNPVIGNAQVSASGNYQVTVTDSNGCGSAVAATVVTVNTLPAATASNDGPSCAGTDIQLTGGPAGMTSYAWSGPLGFSSNVQNPLLTSIGTDGAGNYTLTVTDANGCSNSAATPVVVNALPEVTLTNSGDVCEGGTIVLAAGVIGGSAPYSYVWEKDGSVLPGITTSTLTFNGATLANSGVYEVFVTDVNNCGNAISATSTVVVNQNPVISSVGNNGPMCEGQTLTLSASVSGGTLPYNFSWTGPNGFVSTNQNPTINNVGVAAAGDYQVAVTDINGCSSVTALTTAVVNEVPAVAVSNTGPVCEGETVTISATVSGGNPPYSYAWTKNGAALPGVTTSGISFASVSVLDAGTYEVSVTDANMCASVSASTQLVINQSPTVSMSGDVAVCEGHNATLTATASGGDGNYFYSWSRNGVQIPGETNTSLTVANATVAQSGNYAVTVTDGNSCSGSASAILTVNENPVVSIAGGPVVEACLGTNLTLDASASGGSGSYNFMWQLPNGSNLNGEDLPLNGITAGQAGIYSVIVTDGASCSNTAQVELVVNSATASISISSPSGGSGICAGDAVTFNAGGGTNYTFYVNGAAVASNTTGTYTTSALLNGDQVYAHVVDDKGCEDNSQIITMTVNPNPIVSLTVTSAQGNTPCLGQTVEFTATPGYVNYVFYVNGIEIQNGASNIYSSDALSSGDQVTVLAQSVSGCSGSSAPQMVTFNPLPVATLVSDQPGNTACPGQLVTFTAGGGDTYEFLVEGISQGAASAINTLNMNAPATGSSSVSVVVTDGNGCANSAIVELLVHDQPVVTLGADQSVCQGTPVNISASVTGGTEPYTYSWTRNGTPLPGVTTPSLSFTEIAPADAGLYEVTVTDANACGGVTESVNIQVAGRPSVTLSSNAPVCEGEPLTLSATAYGGSGSGSFVWYKSGVEIPGVTTPEFTISNAGLADAGSYEVIAIDGNGCESQTVATVAGVSATPTATLSADQLNIFQGTEVTFTAGGGAEYIFFLNGAEVQVRSSVNVYTSSSLSDGDEVSVEVFNADDCSDVAAVTIQVYDAVGVPDVSVENNVYCEGAPGATITVDNPQTEVTYEIVFADNSSAGYSLIVYDGTNPVEWVGVTDQQNPTTYKVAAYRAELPADIVYSSEIQVVENPLPQVYTMSVDGAVVTDNLTVSTCNSGVGYNIGLSPSSGTATYQLLLNGSEVLEEITGSPVPIVFSDYKRVGIYTIRAISAAGCSAMMSGSFTIEGDGTETGFNLSTVPADGLFCEGAPGVEITLDGSLSGSDYVLYRDGTPVVTTAGTGSALHFGAFNQGGNYHSEVVTSGGCVYPMNNAVTLISQPLPTIGTLAATDGGSYCEGGSGVRLSLDNQEDGVRYELVNTGTQVVEDVQNGASGNGTLFFKTSDGDDFFTDEANYQVRAVEAATGCEAFSNDISVVIEPLPVIYPFSGDAGYCAEGGEAILTVDQSQNDVSYELYRDGSATGFIQPGDGNPLSYGVSQPGDYTVMAVNNNTGCSVSFTDVVVVSEKPMPLTGMNITSVVTGSAANCDEGAVVTIESSEDGVDYELVKILSGGALLYTGNRITGDGSNVEFPQHVQDKDATYGVMAVLDGCSKRLDNTVYIDIASVPQRFELVYNGNMCADDVIQVGLSGVETGVNYELYREGEPSTVIETLHGDDGELTFTSELTIEDTYYVMGVSIATGCRNPMMGEMELNFNPLPTKFDMTGSGFHCGAGAVLGLEASEPAVEYHLYWNNAGVKEHKESQPGSSDGGAIGFAGSWTEGGFYSVLAVNTQTGCTSLMNDSVEVVLKTAPEKPLTLDMDTVYYCIEESAHPLAITNAEEGVTYQMFNRHNDFVTEAVGGSEELLVVGEVTGGAYVVRASWGGDACISENSDSVWVFQAPDPVPVSPFSDEETIYRRDQTIEYTFTDVLQEGVTYWLINETTPADTIEFTPDGISATVTISETGSYKLLGFFAGYGCEPVSMNGRLAVLDAPLVAVEDYLWLSDGENVDSLYLGVNDLLSYIDLDNVEFALLQDGNVTNTLNMAEGTFTVTADGLLVFRKTPTYYGTLVVTYRVWNKSDDSRYSTAEVTVYVGNKNITDEKSILVPNAFTPNDDGYNDRFKISTGEFLVDESHLEVFNRWGTVVYRSRGKTYDNSWDGTSNVSAMISIGDKLPDGVYFYIFSIKAKEGDNTISKKFNGFIELRR